MVAISSLRLARIQQGMSMDDVSFRSHGQILPGRLSRIERGFARPTEREIRLLREILGVPEETITSAAVNAQPAHAT